MVKSVDCTPSIAILIRTFASIEMQKLETILNRNYLSENLVFGFDLKQDALNCQHVKFNT